ncbi:hypothetical protein ACFE04_013842 [Oxalis oulophora]
MSQLSKKFVLFIAFMSLFKVALSADYIVGDSEGWTAMGGVDYKEWASQKSFHIGDTIEFQYNNHNHNVKQVTEEDFQQCSPASPIGTYTTGSDKIVLEKAEHYYFLCGYPGHCQAGQKIDILVKPASSPPSNPTASSPSSSNSTPDNTASSPKTPSTATLFHSSILMMGLTSLLLLVF